MFVCLFVGIKPEKLYFASSDGREVYPLGVITTERHKEIFMFVVHANFVGQKKKKVDKNLTEKNYSTCLAPFKP